MQLKEREKTRHMDLAAKYMRGLGDSTRLMILQLLTDREEMSVSELVEALGDIAQARVSDHLACLKWCRYVSSRRQGRFVFYRIEDRRVVQLVALAKELADENAEQLTSCHRIKEGE